MWLACRELRLQSGKDPPADSSLINNLPQAGQRLIYQAFPLAPMFVVDLEVGISNSESPRSNTSSGR
jgi:hypothetical protein